MNWLPREKRNPFYIVVFITAVVLALLGLGLIRSQYASIARLANAKAVEENKLDGMERMIKNADATANELADLTLTLSRVQTDMASGDLYSWTYDTVRRFKQSYSIDIPQVGHPSVEDVDLLPSFPYKQLEFTVNGTAYYHDLGKFIADFENNFPYARVVDLVIEPDATGSTEKLSFQMQIIVLVKPNPE